GSYTLDVSATDADSDWVGDASSSTDSRAVTVSDDDTAGPVIVLGGSTGSENDGQTQEFTWSVSDASGLSALSVVIKKNGSQIYSTSNTADAVGSFNFDSYGPEIGR